jgi:hypothetical protein
LPDGEGLSVLVQPTGAKWWRFRYRFDGKQKMLSFGTYPDIGLAEACDKRGEARKLLASGVDPSVHRKATKAGTDANSFEVICREWLAGRRGVVAPAQVEKTLARMVNDVFPWIGSKPITDLENSAPTILAVLRRIDERGARYTAHRARGEISQTFRYAIATGRATRDPCPDLRGAIPAPKETNFPSITAPADVAALLRAIDCEGAVHLAHR